MITEEEVLDRYMVVLQDLSTKPIIYVEGKTIDKMFYSSLKLFKNANLIACGSCINVRKFVRENHSSLGVLDRDYDDYVDSNRIFKTRFYSLENIVLVYDDRYCALRKLIKDEIGIVLLNDKKYRICESKLDFDHLSRKQKFNFWISLNYHDKQYFKYIKKRIFTKSKFLRLKNLKKTIKNYWNYYIQTNSIRNEIWYDKRLAKQIDERTVFYDKDYKKLIKLI